MNGGRIYMKNINSWISRNPGNMNKEKSGINKLISQMKYMIGIKTLTDKPDKK